MFSINYLASNLYLASPVLRHPTKPEDRCCNGVVSVSSKSKYKCKCRLPMDISEHSLNNNYTPNNQCEPSLNDNFKYPNSEYKECANCGVNDTPLWRKYNDHDLCNACGIYFRVNGFHRPFLPNMRKLLSSARKMGLSCVNCGTNITSMWRRTPEGESICNACGLYYRLNGVKRPVSMRKDWIRKRQRKAQQISGIMRLANQTGAEYSQPRQSTSCNILETTSLPAHCLPPAHSISASFQQQPDSNCNVPIEYAQYCALEYQGNVLLPEMDVAGSQITSQQTINLTDLSVSNQHSQIEHQVNQTTLQYSSSIETFAFQASPDNCANFFAYKS